MTADRLHRFSFYNAPIRGNWVRLDAVLAEVFARQPYPDRLQTILGEALGAVAMLADTIKFEGTVSLQSRGRGPLTTLLAECRCRDVLRGIARWDQSTDFPEDAPLRTLLGDGQLAISLVDSDPSSPRPVSYQGLVALDHGDLAGNLEGYFASSEQLPTRFYFGRAGHTVTGLLLQRLPAADDATEIELDQHQADWNQIQEAAAASSASLAALPPEALLGRLFPTRALTLQPARPLTFGCTCSRDRSTASLDAVPPRELLDILESDGEVTVTCEICGTVYAYDPIDVHLLLQREAPQLH
ncbi:MAG: Hsp33 family molecular chaperone HslO [Gammaproteobacteria bacterium]|nr:MAG: Hsp33 family molecular chaperone HslO [Gammaproteobacteria bacterium]